MVQIPFHHRENSLFEDGSRPVLLYAGQISDEPEWSFPSHKHDDLIEIIYISEGNGTFIIDNKKYSAGKGDILIYNQGALHEEKSNPDDPLKTYFCGVGNLHVSGLDRGCIIPAHAEPVIHAGIYSYQMEQYISTLFTELRSQVWGFETICQNTLNSIIVVILRLVNMDNHSAQPASSQSLGYRIKDYIDQNYTREIPLSEIANRLYISPHYLSHIFKEETGNSPINYLIQRRVGEAMRLLLTTSMTVQEIASEVGYDNANYFSMVFKKATGTSPSLFRKNQVDAR
ncbi:AraC family transcriptional regulator [Cohnella silvisoli]|uniref:AraC family transcriptional regulator n=1 Tax=Cohnella silvisoli TaxID=2873699 RepID=A0ABV1KTK9_9BACL|nr:AraC family transcriptional regulator [Cohnella silvisoli]MCD9022493.1 AraC family transcriptional regulator [Cohnella silvisoli]